jgi:hypothetical protein
MSLSNEVTAAGAFPIHPLILAYTIACYHLAFYESKLAHLQGLGLELYNQFVEVKDGMRESVREKFEEWESEWKDGLPFAVYFLNNDVC